MAKRKNLAAGAGTPAAAEEPTRAGARIDFSNRPSEIRTGFLQRSLTLERSATVEEDGVLELTFSSEAEVVREFPFQGIEVLDHSAESVRLDRLKQSGSVVAESHRGGDLVGKVLDAWIEGRRGHAKVKLGTHAEAMRERDLINQGIRTNVSARYRIHKVRVTSRANSSYDEVRAVDWEPYHIALINDPEDYSIGIGRESDAEARPVEVEYASEQEQDRENEVQVEATRGVETMKHPQKLYAPEDGAGGGGGGDPVDVKVIAERAASDARDREAKRTARIRKIAAQFRTDGTMVDRALGENWSPEKFMDEILSKQEPGSALSATDGAADVDLSTKERRSYSFFRAINAQLDPQNKRLADEAGLELEVSNYIAERSGKPANGFYVPRAVVQEPLDAVAVFGNRELASQMRYGREFLQNVMMQRATLDTTTAGKGPELVATELLSGSFIDALRAGAPLLQRGITLDNLQGDIDIPRRKTASSPAAATSGTADFAESEGEFDTVAVRPHDIGAWIQVGRRLLQQESVSLENFLRTDLALGIGIEGNRQGVQGTGLSGQIEGYLNVSGIGSVTSGGTLTWPNIVELWTDVAGANAIGMGMGFHAAATVIGKLMSTEKASGTARYLSDDGRVMMGYDIVLDNSVPSDTLAFLDFGQIIAAMWGAIDVSVDKQPKSHNVIITAHQTMDFVPRQELAISAAQDITP
jgi:HK97 family phage major capsid protein